MNTMAQAIQSNPEFTLTLEFERHDYAMKLAEEIAEKTFFRIASEEEERIYQALVNTRRHHSREQAEIFRLAEVIRKERNAEKANFLRADLKHTIKLRNWYREELEGLEVRMYQIRKTKKGV